MSQSSNDPTDRRTFLASGVGLTLAAATTNPSNAEEPAKPTPIPKPVQLPDWLAPSERKSAGPPNPYPPDRRVGFALVGLGRLTLEQLLPAFTQCKYARPVALVSGDADKATTIARQYGIPESSLYNYQTFDRIQDNPAIQVVYIVLPNGMHHEFTLRAFAAGKHVLCEKPMANSVRECEEMIAAGKKADKQLMIAYRLQYEPHHRWLIEKSRGGMFGALKYLLADNGQNEGQARSWRQSKQLAGGGALPDIGLYCLSFCRYITGEEPTQIYGRIASTPGDQRFKEVEENVLFQLQFPSGVLASCTTGYGQHNLKRLRIAGETGWADMEPGFTYSGLKLRTKRSEGSTDVMTEHTLGARDQFAIEIDHMARCVLDKCRPHTPGEEGLQDQRLMETIYRSAELGKPIDLPAMKGKDLFRGPVPEMG